MNQPAAKEPTMDEILSSIRQIIADDDEAAAQKMPALKAAAARPPVARPAEPEAARTPVAQPAAIDPFSDDEEDDVPPLALSPEQIIAEAPKPAPEPERAEAAPDLVVPDDVAFEQDNDDEPVFAPAPPPEASARPAAPRVSATQAAPMPDPDLTRDLAEELLEPATTAAVHSAFAKLNTPKLSPAMPLDANGLTIEAMIRDMLRPMLKDWLDENLPSMVERIVAQEIERASRGG